MGQLDSDTSNKDNKLLEKSKSAYKNQDFEKARKILEKCLESEDLNAQGYVYQILGDIEFALKNFGKAKEAYIKSIQLSKPSHPSAHKSQIGMLRSDARIDHALDTAMKKSKKMEKKKPETADSISSTAEQTEFNIIEQVPIYPGCEGNMTNRDYKSCMQKAINTHISKNFQTSLSGSSGLAGTIEINVEFKISKTGAITDVFAFALNPLFEHEAIRVIKKLPDMQPGMQKGKPVGVIYGLPIIFANRK